MRKSDLVNGIPIPHLWQDSITWINLTPHLSSYAAKEHQSILSLATSNPYASVKEWLLSFDTYNEIVKEFEMLGPTAAFRQMTTISAAAQRRRDFMITHLEDNKEARERNPLLRDEKQFLSMVSKLDAWIKTLETPLASFERKMLVKYLSDSSSRSLEGYVKQVETNYLTSRSGWRSKRLPRMDVYEGAISRLYSQMAVNMSPKDQLDRMKTINSIQAARSSTFGGAPYYINMGEFLDVDDPNNDMTYADLYNRFAIFYLLLPPALKRAIVYYYKYTALERVQHGGYEGDVAQFLLDAGDVKFKLNKQRFVQAESAVLSHALKIIHDVALANMRMLHPFMFADKLSDEYVAANIKFICRYATDHKLTIQGADWSNYDADNELPLSNDMTFNVLRKWIPPDWVEWVLDPYVVAAYTMKIFVPTKGLVITTGVKSGQVFTNLADTINAVGINNYELGRLAEDESK